MKCLRTCVLTAALALRATTASTQGVQVGVRAPEIDLPGLDGNRLILSRLRGHPVVISFWGSWCPPCRSEFPELVRAHEAHDAGELRIIGINGRDQERRTTDVQVFVNEFAVTFPIGLDERGRARRAYGLIGLPTTVFVDSGGVVKRVHIGPIDREQLRTGIAAIHSAP